MPRSPESDSDNEKPKDVNIEVPFTNLGFTGFPPTSSTTILKLKFNLLENAISSLEEGVKKFLEAKEEKDEAFKFSILHVAHFIELIFKYYVHEQHPLLIYSKPHKPIHGDLTTINADQAIQVLKNCGIKLEKNIESDISELKKVRNKIEHYEFELDVKRTEEIIGKLIYDLILFDTKNFDTKLNECLEPKLWEKLHELSEAHESKVKLVEAEAGKLGRDIYTCYMCGYNTQVLSEDEEGEVTCLFCKYSELIKECFLDCGQSFPVSQMILWNDEDGRDDYICEYCEDHYLSK